MVGLPQDLSWLPVNICFFRKFATSRQDFDTRLVEFFASKFEEEFGQVGSVFVKWFEWDGLNGMYGMYGMYGMGWMGRMGWDGWDGWTTWWIVRGCSAFASLPV